MTAAKRQLENEMLDQPVCSLQYMLMRLGEKYDFLPQLAVDGMFDERTLEAVMLFQRELFPPVNGGVNQDVWNAIRNEWIGFELEHAPPRALRGFPSSASAGLGDQGSYLLLPQAMFQSLSQILEGVAEESLDGQHDEVSAANARWLQRKAGLDETGEMNKDTWNALTRLYELFIVREPQVVVQAGGHG